MANDVQNLLDMLYTLVDEAKNAPLSNDKCVINRDEALDLLDEIRGQLPAELKRAREILLARDRLVEEAKREVEQMRRQAEFDVRTKVSDSEITAAAREKGHDIIAGAEERCREMYRARSCTMRPIPIPRMRCAAPRRPFRWLCARCRNPAPVSALAPLQRCSASRRS